jgi:anaerobic ribonucleoside-triphosphate reductase activating protein
MNYAEIKQFDIANGPGVRVSLFISGCTHHCEGCFNEITWDFNYGKTFTEVEIEYILKTLELPYVNGLTLLGGEPFEHINQRGLLPLLRQVKEKYKDKDIWCYTGYLFDIDIRDRMCKNGEETNEMLSYIDVLVDGKFELDKKDISLVFKGSSNQRIICVKETLEAGKIVLWN